MTGTFATVAVLLVEDDAMVRGWVRMSLEGTEFRLAGEASSAAEALELVQRRAPDVLFVDYRLVGCNRVPPANPHFSGTRTEF